MRVGGQFSCRKGVRSGCRLTDGEGRPFTTSNGHFECATDLIELCDWLFTDIRICHYYCFLIQSAVVSTHVQDHRGVCGRMDQGKRN
jgi:hypothetical protein